MKTTLRYTLAAFLFIALLFKSCKKEDDKNPDDSFESDTPLTDEQVAFLDSVKDTIVRAEDIIMSNGQSILEFLKTYDPGFLESGDQKSLRSGSTTTLTPRLQKETFIARMLYTGVFLVDRSLHVHPADGSDPAQTGLGYSYGSKDYDIRQSPPHADEECKTTRIYGLDCSGMMWVMTQRAGISVVPKESFRVATISDAQKWTDAFKNSSDLKDLKMEDKGQIGEGDMKNGDIILWGSHVGIYLYGTVFQSNGTSHWPGCQLNTSESRGPREISVSEVLKYGLGSYKVFRLSSGDDYTLKVEINIVDYSLNICVLGPYKEEALINITRKEDDIILNYINNTDPSISWGAKLDCKCLGMSFSNGSMITITDFRAHFLRSGYIGFNLFYTFNTSTDIISCSGAPNIIYQGMVSAGMQIQDSIQLPKKGDPANKYPITIWSQGTLTVERDDN